MNIIASNFSWIIVSRIIQSLINFVIIILTSRYLGPANYGLISYATSFAAFFLPIAYLGINNTIVNELIKHKNSENIVLGTAIFLSATSSILCMVFMGVFVIILNPNEPVTHWVCVLYSLTLLFQALDLIQYWFQAHLLAKYSSKVIICAFIIVAIYKFILLATGQSIYLFAISNAIDYFLIFIALLFIYKKRFNGKLTISLKYSKDLIRLSCPYILADLMVALFAQTDRIMLKSMVDETAVGIYSAATTICGVVGFIFIAILDTARPIILDSKAKNILKFEDLLTRLYSVIIYFSLVVSILIAIFSKTIINILYGSEYSTASIVTIIIVWYTIFSYIGSVRNIWILAENKQKYLSLINFIGAITNIILNLFMIPLWGVNGAALASLITQFITNIIIGFILRPIRENNKIMLKSLNPRFLDVRPFLKAI